MVAFETKLPQARLNVLNPDGTFQLPWYRFFQQLGGSTGDVDPSSIAALQQQVQALQDQINAIYLSLPGSLPGPYFDDADAAANGIEIGQWYRNFSVVQMRIA